MSSRKGSRRERELRDRLRDHGWTIMRAPASGGGNADDLPDIFAGDGRGRMWAIEAKTSTPDSAIYLPAEEVASLVNFAEGFHPDVWPVIATRWDRDTDWYVSRPRSMYRTDSGSRRAKYETCKQNWQRLADLASVEK